MEALLLGTLVLVVMSATVFVIAWTLSRRWGWIFVYLLLAYVIGWIALDVLP